MLAPNAQSANSVAETDNVNPVKTVSRARKTAVNAALFVEMESAANSRTVKIANKTVA